MINKDIKDYCKNCDVEPPAMRFKCPECEHNLNNENNFEKDINVPSKEIKDSLKNHSQNFSENSTQEKEQIIIDGVDVSECKHLYSRWSGSLPKDTCAEYDYINNPEDDGLINLCKTHPNCYYKQLQKEKFENLNNRQMVENAENLIYENSELYKNLKEKEQECEELKKANQHIDTNRQCKGSKLKRIEELISDCETGYTDAFIQKIYGIIQEQEPTVNDYSITDRYRRALEEIEVTANKAVELPCVFSCDCNNCAEKPTKNGDTCIQGAIFKIADIIKKVKN